MFGNFKSLFHRFDQILSIRIIYNFNDWTIFQNFKTTDVGTNSFYLLILCNQNKIERISNEKLILESEKSEAMSWRHWCEVWARFLTVKCDGMSWIGISYMTICISVFSPKFKLYESRLVSIFLTFFVFLSLES